MHIHQTIACNVKGLWTSRSPPWTTRWLEWPSLPIQEAWAQKAWTVEPAHLAGCEQEARAGEGWQQEPPLEPAASGVVLSVLWTHGHHPPGTKQKPGRIGLLHCHYLLSTDYVPSTVLGSRDRSGSLPSGRSN